MNILPILLSVLVVCLANAYGNDFEKVISEEIMGKFFEFCLMFVIYLKIFTVEIFVGRNFGDATDQKSKVSFCERTKSLLYANAST